MVLSPPDAEARSGPRGRRGLVMGACAVIVFAAMAAIWAAFSPRSQELMTELGPMPLNPQDEVRVTGEVWLALGLAIFAFALSLLWWFRGPRRGPGALGVLVGVCVLGGAAALGAYDLVIMLRAGSPELVEGRDYALLSYPDWAPVLFGPALVAVACYTILVIGSRRDDLARRTELTDASVPSDGASVASRRDEEARLPRATDRSDQV
ncbi:hypothetical protein EK0264_01660 [Epidermidibacterium keratini]|uniref:DUF2567 domain-containing protein n=1 Tax=Epidermidibacterium keratini TaxID=1891644 RepID=A0A7L4YJ31_9ACTN|nr:hypothetical protein [Epidermidibacterium keratini]QHB99121.1 hypothetical protein EK0264_01660 [Epidermidibacterium keratini]